MDCSIALLLLLGITDNVGKTVSESVVNQIQHNSAVNADIVFILDSSGSIFPPDYSKMLDFVKDSASKFTIVPYNVRVGIEIFGDSPHIQFHLDKYTDSESLQNAISNIPPTSGTTNTAEALMEVRNKMFVQANGDRPDVANIVIVVTDGPSADRTSTLAEAKILRDQDVQIFVVGVGTKVDKRELDGIATDPDSNHVLMVTDFSGLTVIADMLISETRAVSQSAVNKAQQNTVANADIVFILDSSGSIFVPDYIKMLDFVKDLARKFTIGPNNVRIGIEIFSDIPYIQFHLNNYTDSESLQNAISKIPFTTGTTNTAEALMEVRNKMFVQANGDRLDVANIAIVVTDGPSADRTSTLAEAKKLRDQDVHIFVVGVGTKVDKSELDGIATDPDSNHVLMVTDFSGLTEIADMLISETRAGSTSSISESIFQFSTCQAGRDMCTLMSFFVLAVLITTL